MYNEIERINKNGVIIVNNLNLPLFNLKYWQRRRICKRCQFEGWNKMAVIISSWRNEQWINRQFIPNWIIFMQIDILSFPTSIYWKNLRKLAKIHVTSPTETLIFLQTMRIVDDHFHNLGPKMSKHNFFQPICRWGDESGIEYFNLSLIKTGLTASYYYTSENNAKT